MKQKFGKLSFVRVCKDMPECMSHFDSDFHAIVCGTHSQIYGGPDINRYSLYKLLDGKVVNMISWYDEDQLTICEQQDRDEAEDLIEQYNLTRR